MIISVGYPNFGSLKYIYVSGSNRATCTPRPRHTAVHWKGFVPLTLLGALIQTRTLSEIRQSTMIYCVAIRVFYHRCKNECRVATELFIHDLLDTFLILMKHISPRTCPPQAAAHSLSCCLQLQLQPQQRQQQQLSGPHCHRCLLPNVFGSGCRGDRRAGRVQLPGSCVAD